MADRSGADGGVHPVDTGASLVNLDKFIEARFAAEIAGSELTHWIVKPAIAEALSRSPSLVLSCARWMSTMGTINLVKRSCMAASRT